MNTNDPACARCQGLEYSFGIEIVREWIYIAENWCDLLPLKCVGRSDESEGGNDYFIF